MITRSTDQNNYFKLIIKLFILTNVIIYFILYYNIKSIIEKIDLFLIVAITLHFLYVLNN